MKNGCEDVDDLVFHERESEIEHTLRKILRQELCAFGASSLLQLQTQQEAMAKILDSVRINQDTAMKLLRRATSGAEHPGWNTDKQHKVGQKDDAAIVNLSQVIPSSKVQGAAKAEGGTLTHKQTEDEWWAELQGRSGHADENNLWKAIIAKRLNRIGLWQQCFDKVGLGGILHSARPEGFLANIVEGARFNNVIMLLIFFNTFIMGYEANTGIQLVLSESQAEEPQWLAVMQLTLNFVFAAELLLRLCVVRYWFFVSPDWAWNLLDLVVVLLSVTSDLFQTANVSFLRSVRAIRAFRGIRVLRVFRELRRIMLAMLACFSTLAWCFLFFSFMIFMFAVLFVEGLAQALRTMPVREYEVARDEVKEWYADLGSAMLSLFAAATGGMDWMDILAPLKHAGPAYSIAFLAYIIFVVIGMMNVLTGIFVSSADESSDFPLAIENERRKTDAFVVDMLGLFREFNIAQDGELDWNGFDDFMKKHDVQAYLAGHGLQTSHSHLVFQLLVDEGSNLVKVDQLILGFLKMKSEAKALDAKIIRREVAALRPLIKSFQNGHTQFTPIHPNSNMHF